MEVPNKMKKTRGSRMKVVRERAKATPGGKGHIRHRPAGIRIMNT